ncbi:methyltransferase-like protein 25B [Mixophyes fleayi]|uniref:methyltransferase-like protein 25B n=1 Tax=Mixophyes fleayi TaxID=3061075 RepID=UPI003F4DFE9E
MFTRLRGHHEDLDLGDHTGIGMSSDDLNPVSLNQNKQLAVNITRVLSIYGYITDSYVIEFFTDNLWKTLPEPWTLVLSDLSAPQLAVQLLSKGNTEDVGYTSVWPLSLLALKAAAHSLAFQRTPRRERGSVDRKRPAEFQANHGQSSLLDPLFRKHVKPKKQHEIRQLGKLVKKLSDATSCNHVVDIGSGQGHLSRVLSFGEGLYVTAVEANRDLTTAASKFDQDLMYMLKKDSVKYPKSSDSEATNILSSKPPRHVLAFVDPRASWEDFLKQLVDPVVKTPLQAKGENRMTDGSRTGLPDSRVSPLLAPEENPMSSQMPPGNCTDICGACSCHGGTTLGQRHLSPLDTFILTGLHACGDLSVAMLRHFARCPIVAGITSVACCYMKLTTLEVPQPPSVPSLAHPGDSNLQEFGYPMSSWVSGLPGHKLSYKSREVACHAIEDYIERLKGDSDILRTHCYRAVLETVIRGVDPTMKRAGVQTIKKAHKLPFKEYAKLGLKRVGMDPNTPLDEASVEHMLAQHRNVVAFFSLALLLAPLVETLILLDRMIFLQEQGFHCDVIPLFKPQFSPRNLVLVAVKETIPLGDLWEEITARDSGL